MGRADAGYIDNGQAQQLADNVKYVPSGSMVNQANLEETLNKFKESLRKEMEEELMEKIKWINVGASAAVAGGMAMASGGVVTQVAQAPAQTQTVKKSVADDIDDLLAEDNAYDDNDYDVEGLFDSSDDIDDLFSDTDNLIDSDDLFDEDETYESVTAGDGLVGDDFADFDDDSSIFDDEDSDDLDDDDVFGDDDDDDFEDDDDDEDDDDFDDDDDYDDDDDDFDDDDDDFDDDDDDFDSDDYEPAPFLFAELLSEAAEEYAEMSLDERMSEAGKEVMEITVEDLADYIKQMRKKKKE